MVLQIRFFGLILVGDVTSESQAASPIVDVPLVLQNRCGTIISPKNGFAEPRFLETYFPERFAGPRAQSDILEVFGDEIVGNYAFQTWTVEASVPLTKSSVLFTRTLSHNLTKQERRMVCTSAWESDGSVSACLLLAQYGQKTGGREPNLVFGRSVSCCHQVCVCVCMWPVFGVFSCHGRKNWR